MEENKIKRKLEEELNRLLDILPRLNPDTDEYRKTRQEAENLQTMLLEDERLDEEMIDKRHNRDLREQELDERMADSKRKAKSTIWAALLGLGATIVAGAAALFGQYMLRETKEEQGVVDRDEFAINRTTFPRV